MGPGQDEKKGAKGLKKNLGAASVFAICTGAAFSSGFFLLPGFAADETGPSLPVTSFQVSGFITINARPGESRTICRIFCYLDVHVHIC
jgi:hypothetical protein